MTDAWSFIVLHQDEHKIPVMMDSVDVTKVHSKKCHSAQKGQFPSHEKYTDIGLEAVGITIYGSGMLQP